MSWMGILVPESTNIFYIFEFHYFMYFRVWKFRINDSKKSFLISFGYFWFLFLRMMSRYQPLQINANVRMIWIQICWSCSMRVTVHLRIIQPQQSENLRWENPWRSLSQSRFTTRLLKLGRPLTIFQWHFCFGKEQSKKINLSALFSVC